VTQILYHQILNPSSSLPSADSDHHWPIALRIGTRSNPYPIYNFFSYHRLSHSYSSFVFSLSTITVPNNVYEALGHPGWWQAMIDEMLALKHSDTWKLVPLPLGKRPMGCRWVYAIKVGLTVEVDRLKACLVDKGYTQVYGLGYCDTFSLMAKINIVHLFLTVAPLANGLFTSLTLKNAFLYGDLEEEIYIEQLPEFVAQGEYGLACNLFALWLESITPSLVW